MFIFVSFLFLQTFLFLRRHHVIDVPWVDSRKGNATIRARKVWDKSSINNAWSRYTRNEPDTNMADYPAAGYPALYRKPDTGYPTGYKNYFVTY